MERTLSKLNRQITQRLKGINEYEAIHINKGLIDVLDHFNIPENAKLACLTIDTSMKHLDDISKNKLSKKSILIGDLLSAHFYTLISEIGDVSYQRLMSEAIIKSNELKTSLHHHSLERHDIYKAVLDIETLFPFITISHFTDIEISQYEIFEKLFNGVHQYYPSYLSEYDEDEINQIIKHIKQS
ncbi:MAG: heptaprenyl diphosphate synthase component 1, partial [Staphylococcus sp.]|nr:heptaprenyl diphosphate synthase component 1 [Staphylococcus sp.]